MAAGWDAACRLERALFERGAVTQVLDRAAAGEHLAPIAAAALAAGQIVIVAAAPSVLPEQSYFRDLAGPDRSADDATQPDEGDAAPVDGGGEPLHAPRLVRHRRDRTTRGVTRDAIPRHPRRVTAPPPNDGAQCPPKWMRAPNMTTTMSRTSIPMRRTRPM